MEGGKRQYTALPMTLTTPDGALETVLQQLDGVRSVDHTDGLPPPSRKWSNGSAKGKTKSLLVPVMATGYGDGDLERNGTELNGSLPRSRSSSPEVVEDEPEILGMNTVPFPETRGALFESRKVAAQGLMDIALLTANASQLKNLMETENHPNYTVCMYLLITSIILQIAVAVLLLVVSRLDSEPDADTLPQKKAEEQRKVMVVLGDFSTAGIFLITVINIFIASFISHGKVYIPPGNAESAWNQEMSRQRAAPVNYVPNITDAPTLP
ncbi:hypothetical protein BV898_04968 [Hypsibius exemplaris]|uniref:Ninjurin-1 n=1 Tax=Hypsibius exemplaris TaxID=2072580 RepID=A0A1W0X178_HYPEX|nr:hypothetical protein BV898_04968 [Hypsibius exemplaris]